MSAEDQRALPANSIFSWIEAKNSVGPPVVVDSAPAAALDTDGQAAAITSFGDAGTGLNSDPSSSDTDYSRPLLLFGHHELDHFDFGPLLSPAPLAANVPGPSADLSSPLDLAPDSWGAPSSLSVSVSSAAPIRASQPHSPNDSHVPAPSAVRDNGASEISTGKLDGLLAGLASARGARMASLAPALPGSIVDGKYITIDATAKDGDGAVLLRELDRIGLQNGAAFAGVASGEIPIARLAAMAGLSDLAFAHEDALVTGKVSFPPQAAWAAQALGLTVTGTDGHTHVIDGSGLKIGILSDSFNTSGNADTMQTDIAQGNLPADTTILQDSPNGTDEGRAMAEIVHEIAPGASIIFATAYAGEAAFAANIIALANAGAKIIVDDVGYYDEPAYQDGVIAQAVDYVTSHYGVTYFSAAGNDGSNGYEGAFTRGTVARGEVYDNFTPGHGQHDYLPVTIPAGDEVVFVLQWAQPAASASPGHGATGQLDLVLSNGQTIMQRSATPTIGHDPVQEIDYVNKGGHDRTLYLYVGLHAGAVPTDFKLLALDDGGGATLGTYASNKNAGTIYGHPAAAGAVSVGADFIGDTPAYGASQPSKEYYSSTGPTDIYFAPDGTALAHPIIRTGPDLMAPDGADTSFFGFQINDADSFPNFFGTSAAAPAAAAVEALVLQADPLLTAGQAVNLMQNTALHQPDSPSGLVQAEPAVTAAWDLYT